MTNPGSYDDPVNGLVDPRQLAMVVCPTCQLTHMGTVAELAATGDRCATCHRRRQRRRRRTVNHERG